MVRSQHGATPRVLTYGINIDNETTIINRKHSASVKLDHRTAYLEYVRLARTPCGI